MKKCPFCAEEVQDEAVKCRYCHESFESETDGWTTFRRRYEAMTRDEQMRAWEKLTPHQRRTFKAILDGQIAPTVQGRAYSQVLKLPPPSDKSNGLAFFLGLILGPVGLWYKGNWAAGFAWLAAGIVILIGTGGAGILIAPVLWLGMAIHASVATPKD